MQCGFLLSTMYQEGEFRAKMSEKTFTGVYCDQALLEEIKVNLARADCRTRNEFINKAVRFYLAYLETGENGSTLFPILDDALDGRMKDQEMRLSRILFKLGVEVAIMSHVVAGTNEITDQQLAAIRKLCIEEVAKLSGRYSFEDAVRFQQ